MGLDLLSRSKHAWNAFRKNRDPTTEYRSYGETYFYRPDRPRFSRGNERSIVTAILNQIAVDVSAIAFQHCRLDEEGRFLEVIQSPLNNCLTSSANLDQTGRAFMHDLVMSLLDEGSVAAVPIDTDIDPDDSSSFDIYSIRVGKIIDWHPAHVKVKAYDERDGRKKDITLRKDSVAILENPFYAVMNEPNSTLKRLINKLTLLDTVDERSGSDKLDLIIQLPYVVRGETRKNQAEQRRKDIEMQLAASKYGIAYVDGTERVTQLNRPVENNLLKQIEYLQNLLFSQLGMTQSILDGTADEQTMLNYYTRTIEPIVSMVVDEMKRKFLTKTARSQGQSILYFRDPFKLVPAEKLAEIADKFTRNEILSKNEIRQIIGRKPSKDPKADQLINSNISQPAEVVKSNKEAIEPSVKNPKEGGELQNGSEQE